MYDVKRIVAVYFSPTGNSKKYACAVAEALEESFESLNFTKKEMREKEICFSKEDIVIFSAPVYAGRLPDIGLFENVKGENTPAICIVTYGNRDYDDALLELKNVCEQRGFHPIAAGAFIGEHTFSEFVGADRPNEEDEIKIKQLAQYIKNCLKEDKWKERELNVKGSYPYTCMPKKMPFAPQTNQRCCQCGSCVRKCPVGAIDKETIFTDVEKCIACFACVKGCTRKGRSVDQPQYYVLSEKLEKNLRYVDKEAELFFL